MTRPFLVDADLTLYQGDALEVLRSLPDESVHMCVTSPPFYGLRDYQVEGQIGLEATPEEWCAALVAVFREVRRVLRHDGTFWLEVGDSYWSNPAKGGSCPNGKNEIRWKYGRNGRQPYPDPATFPVKAKDLIGAPWLLAFALRADGWYLRSDIIWSRPNPMPESVTDRPTKSHSYVFLLSKSARYFFDQEAVREPADYGRREWTSVEGNMASVGGGRGHATVRDFKQPPQDSTLDPSLPHEAPRGPDGRRITSVKGQDGSLQHRDGERWPNSGRNIRSVWSIATQAYPDAHFATYPQELVRRCILAGTSERGCCPECGAPWERLIEETVEYAEAKAKLRAKLGPDFHMKRAGLDAVKGAGTGGNPHTLPPKAVTLGWGPSCGCTGLDDVFLPPIPCMVLDPFAGSGTTGLVARKHGRRSVLIELSGAYCELAARRTQQLSILPEGAT